MLFNTYSLYPDENIAVMHIKDTEIIIDMENFEKVKNYKWILSNGKPVRYWTENYKCYTEPLYKTIIEVEAGLTADYINGNRLDLRKENLRVCTLKERCRHHKLFKNNTTGKSGVSRSKAVKYIISITIDNSETSDKERLMTHCDNLEKAIEIRKKLENIYYKDFAPIV